MGGEKLTAYGFCQLVPGSPPHGRGKAFFDDWIDDHDGITPAWAGKSVHPLHNSVMHWDHPRVGGEKGAAG